MADIAKSYYHRVHGAAQMYTIDGDQAVARHPNEWSHKPWTDKAARAAEEADKAAQKRDEERGGRPKDRVPDDASDHAEPVKDPPPKPSTMVDQGLAPGVMPVIDGLAVNDEGVQSAVPNSDFGGNRPVGRTLDETVPDTNVPRQRVDDKPRANPQNDKDKPKG
jgi:hypothetical protein